MQRWGKCSAASVPLAGQRNESKTKTKTKRKQVEQQLIGKPINANNAANRTTVISATNGNTHTHTHTEIRRNFIDNYVKCRRKSERESVCVCVCVLLLTLLQIQIQIHVQQQQQLRRNAGAGKQICLGSFSMCAPRPPPTHSLLGTFLYFFLLLLYVVLFLSRSLRFWPLLK